MQFHATQHTTTVAENCWLSCKFACTNCGSACIVCLSICIVSAGIDWQAYSIAIEFVFVSYNATTCNIYLAALTLKGSARLLSFAKIIAANLCLIF